MGTSGATTTTPWIPRRPMDLLLILGIVVVAFIVRAVPVFRGAGLDGDLGYDDGVYYASAAALVSGLIPYRDFLLLHPPGITTLLSPFALLGLATNDPTGLAVARLAFIALGAVNAGLVTLVAARYGRRAALIAGAFYAVWYGAAWVERTTRLIDPETTLLLIGVLIVGWRRPIGWRRAAAGGAALGLSMAIQVWGVVPLLVVVGAVALESRDAQGGWRRPAVGMLAGAGMAFAAVCLPFFLAAPGEFVRLVILDQMARPNMGISIVTRLRALEGLPAGRLGLQGALDAVGIGLAVFGTGVVAWVAWRVAAARMWCVLLVVEMTYLLMAPVFIPHYSGWTAPAVAIVLGIAASSVIEAADRRRALGAVARAGTMAILAILAVTSIRGHAGTALPRVALEADIRGARCVSANMPILLVETSGLRRDLQAGCPLIVDPTGVAYDTDRGTLAPGPVEAARRGAPGYQAAMERYYSESDAAMFDSHTADGLTATTRAAIARNLPVVLERGLVTVMLRH